MVIRYVDEYGGYIDENGIFHREKDGYIRILLDEGLIFSGCARCMMDYGLCGKAVWYCSDKVATTDCTPFGDYEGTVAFPNACLKDWGSPCVEGD